MSKFRPTRAQDENVHVIRALGGFRATTKVWQTPNGLTVQSWKIENGFELVEVTATSTHTSGSTFKYMNTASSDISDDGTTWEFGKKLDQDETFNPADESMTAQAHPQGRLLTRIAATAPSQVKSEPLGYGTLEQELNWH